MNNGIHWSCRSHDRKRPGKRKISRADTNYWPGIGVGKLSVGRVNQITGKGFTGSVTEGVSV